MTARESDLPALSEAATPWTAEFMALMLSEPGEEDNASLNWLADAGGPGAALAALLG